MNRIFTFGCSFTQYHWPTWADIILYKNDGYNLGISGGGYDSILYRLIEGDRKFHYTSDDQIIIVFTTPLRWDRIIHENPSWSRDGQINLNKIKTDFYCIDGLLFKSYYNIFLIDHYLKNRNLKYIFGSINNLYENIGNYFEIIEILDETKQLIEFIKNNVPITLQDIHSFISPPMYKQWRTKKTYRDGSVDYHPRPKDYFKWVNEILCKHIDIDINVTENDIKSIENSIDVAESIDQLKLMTIKYPEFYSHQKDDFIYL